jgi:hypothetical protein
MTGSNRDTEATLKDLASILEMEMANDEDSYKDGVNTDTVIDLVIEEQFFVVSYKNSVCNVGCGNLNIGNMMNEFDVYFLKKKLFDIVFCRANILSWQKKVGFLLITRNIVSDPKIRYL